jgi:molybdopterin molybdotransferase
VGPVSVKEAVRSIMGRVRSFGIEEVPLDRAAGRVCSQEVRADRDFPPYPRVMMDGIAIAASEVAAGRRAFADQGTQRAGAPPMRLASGAHCIEVMTAAVLLAGCDCIVAVGMLDAVGSERRLRDGATASPGQWLHRQSIDRRAGDVLLRPGTRLLGAEVAVVAQVGAARVRVMVIPRIEVISTGDELVPVEAIPLAHQIRMTNGVALAASLSLAAYDRVGVSIQRDDPDGLHRGMERALDRCDVVITTGAVSAGQADYLPSVFEDLGVQRLFHKVRQRPGLPFWFGVDPHDRGGGKRLPRPAKRNAVA